MNKKLVLITKNIESIQNGTSTSVSMDFEDDAASVSSEPSSVASNTLKRSATTILVVAQIVKLLVKKMLSLKK